MPLLIIVVKHSSSVGKALENVGSFCAFRIKSTNFNQKSAL